MKRQTCVRRRALRLPGTVVLALALAIATTVPAAAVDARITNQALYDEAETYATGQSVGNCKAWVGQVFADVAAAAGSDTRIGPGFYSGFTDAGGLALPLADAQRGDLVFVYNASDPETYYYGMHAAIVVDNLGGGHFNVVDANYLLDGKIMRHVWDIPTYLESYPLLTGITFRLGTVPEDPPDPTMMPVYRFYNARAGTHFYTPSAEERDMVMAKWPTIFAFEGICYFTDPANNTQPLYRFYNLRSQSHFYTASVAERDDVLARLGATFSYDGETYAVCPTEVPGSIAVYRFFNRKNGSHFYTSSIAERDSVKANLSSVYSYEGPAFWLGQ